MVRAILHPVGREPPLDVGAHLVAEKPAGLEAAEFVVVELVALEPLRSNAEARRKDRRRRLDDRSVWGHPSRERGGESCRAAGLAR